MTRPIRLGAVNYLNVRPLVHGLDAHADRVRLRFDVPSECARLLAAGAIDLGMVPSITHVDRPGDRIVPGVCIGSDGPVASVALFTRKPMREVTRIALDTSSRTSAVLTRILCARRFGIDPVFIPRPPDLPSMLADADAALLIGDPALFVDARAHGAMKIDLGAEWTAMTQRPFVWAFWAGPSGGWIRPSWRCCRSRPRRHAAHRRDCRRVLRRDAGPRAAGPAVSARTLMFQLTPRAIDGLREYYSLATELGLGRAARSRVL